MKLSSIALTAIFCASTLLCTTAQAEPLRLGMTPEPYMPFTQVNAAGEWEGFEADLTIAICAKVTDGCERKPMAWEGLMPSLTGNKVDFIVGAFSVTEKRRETVDFSSAYYFEPTVLVGMKSDSIKLTETKIPTGTIVDQKSLKNRIIGVQNASVQSAYAKAYFADLDIKSYTTADNVVADLTAGRIDIAVAAEQFIAPFLVSADGQNYEIKKRLPNNVMLGEGVAYAVRKGDSANLTKINTVMAELTTDGTIDKLVTKWFSTKE